jgi:lysophospholipase L1-like esterase
VLPQLTFTGTNDASGGADAAPQVANNLKKIIDELREYNPQIVILLAQIIPVDTRGYTDKPQEGVDAINDLIPSIAKEKHSAESPVVVVDQRDGFDAAEDTNDGVHPNKSGEEKMAAKWYEAIKTLLEKR